jgi:hypothetical protein
MSSELRLYDPVDTETYPLPFLFLPLKLMMISGLILVLSCVDGRLPDEDGRRCWTMYEPVPVGVGGLIGDGVLLRGLNPFFGWYSVVLVCTFEFRAVPFRGVIDALFDPAHDGQV